MLSQFLRVQRHRRSLKNVSMQRAKPAENSMDSTFARIIAVEAA
jgi:hypothetical protein